jgi:hypothetical protein
VAQSERLHYYAAKDLEVAIRIAARGGDLAHRKAVPRLRVVEVGVGKDPAARERGVDEERRRRQGLQPGRDPAPPFAWQHMVSL